MSDDRLPLDTMSELTGMLDGIEVAFDAGPEDLEKIEHLVNEALVLRDRLTLSIKTVSNDLLNTRREKATGRIRRLDLDYRAFWATILHLATTCQRLTRALAGSRRTQIRSTETGLDAADKEWLIRFLHDRR